MANKFVPFLLPLLIIHPVSGQNPQAHGEYNIEHPNLPTMLENGSVSEDSFWEDFQYESYEDFASKWITPKPQVEGNDFEYYPGQWRLEEAYLVPGFRKDLSLVLGSSEQRSLIARKLPKVISTNQNATLVIQYEVKLQKKLECGGAYMKLYPPTDKDLTTYNFSTPFELVFGPDSCQPYTNEVRLVLKRTNPITGLSQEKYLQGAPQSKLNSPLSHLYTLILDAENQYYEIRIDGKVNKSGSLLQEGLFDPPLSPPKTIPDSQSFKPDAWDDRPMIPDPDAKKPEDWNEDEPLHIPDPKRTKPVEWDESIPEYIIDTQAQKPLWWNEEKDGKWVPPSIKNPSCHSPQGCGKWKPRLVKNPKYRGHWNPPQIPNPNYQGEWKPKMIDNPDYFFDETPALLENDIGIIVFDLWSTSTDTLFDNIYVGHSVEEAEKLGNMTFLPKLRLEKKELKMQEPEVQGISKPTMPESGTSGNLFDILFEKVLSGFSLLDDLVKGIIFGIGLLIVVALTAIVLIKIMLMTPDSESAKVAQRPSKISKAAEKTQKVEPLSEKSAGKSLRSSNAGAVENNAHSTGSVLDEEPEGSTLLSRKVIPLKSDEDYEEELEISVLEENDDDRK
ncbi:LAFE_0D12772g1_1 [Lachancea fermentati]|uniref:LAFE_0D12772g1_1 n=1 Tax=Lachancea fermentati TaxID=4955 RepID=A0A1G4MCM3_LACFM|nr:LAFE_0D12772g1_1 [Lachancea fermentati]